MSRTQHSRNNSTSTPVALAALVLLAFCMVVAVALSSVTKERASARSSESTIAVSVLSSPEKQSVLAGMVERFNKSKAKVAGRQVQVTVKYMESGELLDAVLSGQEKPTAISPASSTWLVQLNAEWKTHTGQDAAIAATQQQLFVTPIVIGMWDSMARAMGYPARPLGWSDVIKATLDPKGWGAFGHSEWGAFRFAHSSPDTDSGRLAILAEFYAGAGKVRGLSQADLDNAQVRDYVRSIEKGVVQYGDSPTALLDLMRKSGQSGLSAAVMEEQSLIQFNLSKPAQKLTAIYPVEGTFWADHPYAILSGEWTSTEQRQAARLFLDYLMAPEQQRSFLAAGFRPGNLEIGLDGSPISAANGADALQPRTLLATPDATILAAARNAWILTKKPANLILVADVSGSMAGDKIARAQQGLQEFVDSVADSDQVGLYKFSTTVQPTVPLARLDQTQRARLQNEISRIVAGGNTALYAAAQQAVAELVRKNDKDSINAVVLMTDGKETMGGSKSDLLAYLRKVQSAAATSGPEVKVFCIAYGSDADMKTLNDMADATQGKALTGSPETIKKLYKLLSTYF